MGFGPMYSLTYMHKFGNIPSLVCFSYRVSYNKQTEQKMAKQTYLQARTITQIIFALESTKEKPTVSKFYFKVLYFHKILLKEEEGICIVL